MKTQTSPPPPEAASADQATERGRRIRWERDSEDADRIIVLDAVTGKVIAIVRSLFEMALE
jgi:hypothetical protein